MQGLDWLILGIYFAVLLAIGVWASTKRKKGGALFLAEHSLRWHHIGFSMWGTNVGPSMLIASASAGFTTGIVSGNYAWYAFVFIALLAFVFAPRYLGANISTLPEFMGLRFGQSTRNILAWYTIVTVIISWLALTLFAGGVLIRQVFDIPMWMSALVLVVISAFFTMLGGLKAVAYTNVYQMILLIVVSLVLVIVGLDKVGGIQALVDKVPSDYWVMFKPNSDEAYLTMVENLFPVGMVGLVFAVLTACLVSTIGSALNALSTVFTMDVYVKNFKPGAPQWEINLVGRIVVLIGAVLAIVMTVAIDAIKGLNLFNVFQSVLGFIAPPMAAVFLLGIFWKRCTTRAANFCLTVGTVFCLTVGILYLWPPAWMALQWPHFMLLSFYLFVILVVCMVLISLTDSDKTVYEIPAPIREQKSRLAIGLWIALAVVMCCLYVYFN